MVGMASPAPTRAVAVGSVALCTAQRSWPTLVSCQPPAPSSKVVVPATPIAQYRHGTVLPGPPGAAGRVSQVPHIYCWLSPQWFSSEPSAHALAKSQTSSALTQPPSSQENSSATQLLARARPGSATGAESDAKSPRLECGTGRV